MTGPDASWHEMPGFTLPGRLGRDADEQLLDTILAGLPLPTSAPREYHDVAEQLSDLARPAGPGLLPGETAALTAFSSSVSSGSLSSAGSRAAADRVTTGPGGATPAGAGPATGRTGQPIGAGRRRNARRIGLLTAGRARIATAVAALGLVLGTTAAAYAGALPAQVQDFAHRIIGAPAAQHPARPPHPASTRQPPHRPVPRPTHPAHQPPGQQKAAKVPPGQAKGHQKHPRPVKPAHSPKPAHTRKPGNPGQHGPPG
jgi:hypothetical protein